MTRLTISLLIVSFILAAGITAAIMTTVNDRKLKQQIEISKKAAVVEFQLRDSLRFERGLKESLVKNNKLLVDSLSQIKVKKNAIQTVIRFIHVAPLTPDELERTLSERYSDTSADSSRTAH